jgi:hypothetical protein
MRRTDAGNPRRRGRPAGWLLVLLLAVGLDGRAGEKPIPYVSPGFRVGYEFGEGLTVGLKISLGINTDPEYWNVTTGFKALMFRKPRSAWDAYTYCQFQAGFLPWHEPIFAGGGIGYAVFSEGPGRVVKPMVTLSCGFLLFCEADLVPLPDRLKCDTGILGVFPVPLRRIDFGSIGG